MNKIQESFEADLLAECQRRWPVVSSVSLKLLGYNDMDCICYATVELFFTNGASRFEHFKFRALVWGFENVTDFEIME